MKKTLIALAVLASTGAAMAQSSVTIYGRADVAVGTEKTLGGSNKSQAFNGGLTTSRLGFRGTEDLGGGLKANFQLEQRLTLSDGQVAGGRQFHGASTVGLSGGFGQIRAGRMTTVLDDVRGLAFSSDVFDSSFTAASNGVFSSGGDFGSRFTSMLRYDLPSMGGVYGGMNYAFEQTAGAKDTLAGFMVGYKAGPMNIALGFQDEKKKNKYTTLAGSYNLGVASISAGYNMRDGATAAAGDDSEFSIGVTVPMGAVSLSAGYATSETEVGTATTLKANGFGLGATYSLSKRTRMYAGYRTNERKTGAGVKQVDTQRFAVGVRHDF
jgi:predicted porin